MLKDLFSSKCYIEKKKYERKNERSTQKMTLYFPCDYCTFDAIHYWYCVICSVEIFFSFLSLLYNSFLYLFLCCVFSFVRRCIDLLHTVFSKHDKNMRINKTYGIVNSFVLRKNHATYSYQYFDRITRLWTFLKRKGVECPGSMGMVL